MDALDFLKSEHESIKGYFSDYEQTAAQDQKRKIFNQIRRDLELHFYLEETILYRAFEDFVDIKDIVKRAFGEHAIAKIPLKRLGEIGVSDKESESLFQELKKSIFEHIDFEETEFFSAIRKVMKRPERERMGRLMQAERQERLEAA
ncbi:MAG TPA: hemerythrin domain-containing protein [Bdellovibrionota bacterium]|nr:hemerythrin domain-containing protein [Bdellovibrionota bacterium]